MHGTMNLKFANAKQAKETHEYRNIKQELHKTTAAIWFNKTCRERGIKPNYINIKINGKSSETTRQEHTTRAATRDTGGCKCST
jgi:hypothetical protein